MEGKKVIVTMPWQNDDIMAAIRANANNYDALEEIRKDLLLCVMELEHRQFEIKYPTMSKENNR